jgi:hypothetical protein
MARIPTKEELGGEQYAVQRQLPQFRAQDFSGEAAVGKALAGVGDAAQKTIGIVVEKQREADDYEVANKIVDFDLAQEKRLDDAKRKTEPEARDFTKTYRSQYDDDARAFMEGIPDRLKPKVDSLLVRRASNYEKRAYDFELKERDRYHSDDVSRRLTDWYNDSTSAPERKDANAERGVAVIRASRLPTNTKLRLEREFLEKNDEFASRAEFERRAAAGEDLGPEIEKLRRIPRGSGLRQPASSSVKFSPEVEGAIGKAATETGVDPEVLRSFVRVESSGNPNTQTGSYRGLFQLSEAEFRKHGGKGSIFNPEENAKAAARKIQAESDAFQQKHGRAPTVTDLYLVHQQGEGGFAAHMNNPDLPAWQNMASTGEGRQKGERWAKQAIWGNLTPEAKANFGSVENVTSGDFVSFWDSRLSGRRVNDPGGTYQMPDPNSGEPAIKLEDARDEPVEDDIAPYRHLSPTTRRKLLNLARTAQRSVMAQKVEGAIVRVRKGEDLEADETGRTPFDKAVEHLTPHQKQEAIARMETARAFSKATRSIQDMTADEADEAVERIGVTAHTPENLVAATDRAHRDALAVRSRLEKMRKADQVAAVWKGDPMGRIAPAREVKEALEKIKALDRSDPEYEQRSWEIAMTARVDAQRRTMPEREPRLLTEHEATRLIDMPAGADYSSPKFRVALQKAADTAEKRYGPGLARAALQDAIRWTITGKDDKKVAEGFILTKVAVGEAITARDIRLMRMQQEATDFNFMGPPLQPSQRDAEGQAGGYYGEIVRRAAPVPAKTPTAPAKAARSRAGKNPFDNDD